MSTAKFKINILSHLFTKFPRELGNIGEYDQCAWIARGTGQFRPSLKANPVVGNRGELESVDENRVEILISSGGREQVVETVKELKKVHPYEEVPYDVYKLEDFA